MVQNVRATPSHCHHRNEYVRRVVALYWNFNDRFFSTEFANKFFNDPFALYSYKSSRFAKRHSDLQLCDFSWLVSLLFSEQIHAIAFIRNLIKVLRHLDESGITSARRCCSGSPACTSAFWARTPWRSTSFSGFAIRARTSPCCCREIELNLWVET
jgi:hypothetical protein